MTHGKYQTTHLLTKLDKVDKKEGALLFVHNNFNFKIIKRGNVCNDDIECVTVEILRNKDKNIIFSGINRPPRCISQIFGEI